jgi:hypothetical protein
MTAVFRLPFKLSLAEPCLHAYIFLYISNPAHPRFPKGVRDVSMGKRHTISTWAFYTSKEHPLFEWLPVV